MHRAKERIAGRRPRFEASPERQRDIVARFFEAVKDGDMSRLENYLAADVSFTADGGGKVAAARRPVFGAERVARLMVTLARNAAVMSGDWDVGLSSINGETALVGYHNGVLDIVFVCSTDGDRITAIRAIRNPDKLRWLTARMSQPA